MPKKQIVDKKVQTRKASRRTRTSGMNVQNSKIEDDKDLDPMSKRALSAIESNYQQILEMQDRILSAPAMNGGFTTLLYKVESIEGSQAQLVEKVDQIHNVLYEPDNGLYARVKSVENECVSADTINVLEKEVQEIKIWKSSEEKAAVKDEAKEDENAKLLLEHEATIRSLQSSIKKYNAAIKWLTVSIGGGLLSMIGKLIYDYLSGHIQIV